MTIKDMTPEQIRELSSAAVKRFGQKILVGAAVTAVVTIAAIAISKAITPESVTEITGN